MKGTTTWVGLSMNALGAFLAAGLLAVTPSACEAEGPGQDEGDALSESAVPPGDAGAPGDSPGGGESQADLGSAAAGTELPAQDACQPDCAGLSCGDDGCGGSCGTCETFDGGEAPELCQADGTCCEQQCQGNECGDDGCGGTCGECVEGAVCTSKGTCCVPDCGTTECGGDGCGGQCGKCGAEEICQGGQCKPAKLYPEDGDWCGNGIKFTVSGAGTWVTVTSASYGSCKSGGCTSSGSATCGSCDGPIDNYFEGAAFSQSDMACSGTFDSETSASGKCTDYSDCGCTMSNSWTASPCD